MSTSLPSPPSQELPDPSSPSAISVPPLPLLAPIPQSLDETNAESSSSLLITPTPSTAPPPPLPVTATPPSAPHPGDDPASSTLEPNGGSRGGGEGLVDAGDVAAMEVEPTSAPPPPHPSASAPSTSTSTSAPVGPTASAPFVPPPPPPRVDPTIALRDFHATMQRRGQRGDTREMRRAALQWTRTEVRPNQFSPLDSYYIVPLILLELALPNISMAVSTLNASVRTHHYNSGNPLYYQLAKLISAVKTRTHSMIWEAADEIDVILAQPPQNEFDPVAKTIAAYLFTFVKAHVRLTNIAVVAQLYRTIPVAEFQRYTGWSREGALIYAQQYSYGFDIASDLLSPVPAPKQLRQATTTTHNFEALARGILQVEMRV